MIDRRRTVLVVSLPAGMRAAVYAEADRCEVPPSRVIEALILRHFPGQVAESMRATFADNGARELPSEPSL